MKQKKSNKQYFPAKPVSTGLWHEQSTILIQAINDYLKWRTTGTDNRGYENGLFSWIRHFRDFGLNRANALSVALQTEISPFNTLLSHFANDSTLANHSLDTYLLEALLSHAPLFQIKFPLTALKTREDRTKLQNYLYQLMYSSNELEETFLAGKALGDSEPEKAFRYLCICWKQNHKLALNELKNLAKKYHNTQFLLGREHYTRQEFAEAAESLFQAEQNGSLEADTFLKKNIFPENTYLFLAIKYERIPDLSKAFYFYKKAALHEKAALRLGTFYEKGDVFLKPDLQQAFQHYQVAAQKKSRVALTSMNNLASKLDKPELFIAIADLHFNIFSEPFIALDIYKKLSDKKLVLSTNKLPTLTKNNADYALYIAAIYHKESNLDEACFYYHQALLIKNNQKAYLALKQLADEKHHAKSMYLLGKYKFHQAAFKEAIDYCLNAVRNTYPDAKTFLLDTAFNHESYLYIARGFKNIKNGDKDALIFYEKAMHAGNATAAYFLGKLWHAGGYPGKNADLTIAFHYYKKAAEKNHQKSMNKMLIIAQKVQSNAFWMELGEMYCTGLTTASSILIALKNMAKTSGGADLLLNKIAVQYAEAAFEIASLYEADNIREERIGTTCFYYILSKENTNLVSNHIKKVDDKLDALLDESTTAQEWILLGELYTKSTSGIPVNFQMMLHYFEKAAAMGSVDASYKIGLHYSQFDKIKAVSWLIKAKDHWFASAALNQILDGNTSEQILHKLQDIFHHGSPELDKNPAYELQCLNNLSKRGNIKASNQLGQFFQLAHDAIPKSDSQSFEYFLKAAKQGDTAALKPLERLAEDLGADYQKLLANVYTTVFKDPEKAFYWSEKAAEANSHFFNF